MVSFTFYSNPFRQAYCPVFDTQPIKTSTLKAIKFGMYVSKHRVIKLRHMHIISNYEDITIWVFILIILFALKV